MNENKATVLVAEDEKDIRDIVRYHLEKEGYNVITSENGKEAIDVLKGYNISLAITDLKMPKVDGFAVLDYIKKYCSFVPVIVLTGYVDLETAVTSMKKGAVDYVPKPIKRDEFMDVVRSALMRKGSTQDLKPFEIVGMYLLDIGGLMIYHKDTAFHSEFDSQIFGSMFTAIKTFLKDSFHIDEELRYIEHGSLKIIIEEGNKFFLVVIGKGDVVAPVKQDMERIVETINRRYGEAIAQWSGNMEAFSDIGREFEGLFRVFGGKKG